MPADTTNKDHRLIPASSEQRPACIELDSAEQAKLDFLTSLNHTIRTPLNGLIGHADLLLNDRYLSPQQRRHAESIRSAGSALMAVANQVLNFAISESEEVVLDAGPFDLRETTEAVLSGARRTAESKGLTFEVHLDPALPHRLVGDSDRLRQVMLNLLENAVKFTAQGRIRASLDVEERPRDCVRLRFSLSDTGIGIAPSRLSGLFDDDIVPDAEIRSQFGGSGLALKVSKRLIEAMGGTLGIDSVPHFGSTVWFNLTLPVADFAPAGMRVDSRSAIARAARILLVEDDEINQEVTRSILEAAGHEVDVACDGAVAVLAVQSNIYHLVLMDVQMPVLDGVSATRLIRSLPGPECDVPVIAMTASILPEQIRSFKEAGMNDHVGKPFQREELLSLVNRWAFDSINQVIHSLCGRVGAARA